MRGDERLLLFVEDDLRFLMRGLLLNLIEGHHSALDWARRSALSVDYLFVWHFVLFVRELLLLGHVIIIIKILEQLLCSIFESFNLIDSLVKVPLNNSERVSPWLAEVGWGGLSRLLKHN